MFRGGNIYQIVQLMMMCGQTSHVLSAVRLDNHEASSTGIRLSRLHAKNDDDDRAESINFLPPISFANWLLRQRIKPRNLWRVERLLLGAGSDATTGRVGIGVFSRR